MSFNGYLGHGDADFGQRARTRTLTGVQSEIALLQLKRERIALERERLALQQDRLKLVISSSAWVVTVIGAIATVIVKLW